MIEHDALLEVLEGGDVDRPERVAVWRVGLEGRVFVRLADGERLGRLGRGSLVDAEEDKGGLCKAQQQAWAEEGAGGVSFSTSIHRDDSPPE